MTEFAIDLPVIWDSWEGRAAEPRKLLSCIHSGNPGDIVYSLPTVRELGARHFVINLCVDPEFKGRNCRRESAEALVPLLLAQPYIERVTIVESNLPLEYLAHPIRGIDFNLDKFRTRDVLHLHLGLSHAEAQNVHVNLYTPWLRAESVAGLPHDYAVLSLTGRYRSRSREYWQEVLTGVTPLMVLGLPKDFENARGVTAGFITCRNFLEMAGIIRGSRLFLGNQSLGFALAEGMKVPRILEQCPDIPNVYPVGENGYLAPLAVMEARALIERLCPFLGESSNFRDFQRIRRVGTWEREINEKETELVRLRRENALLQEQNSELQTRLSEGEKFGSSQLGLLKRPAGKGFARFFEKSGMRKIFSGLRKIWPFIFRPQAWPEAWRKGCRRFPQLEKTLPKGSRRREGAKAVLRWLKSMRQSAGKVLHGTRNHDIFFSRPVRDRVKPFYRLPRQALGKNPPSISVVIPTKDAGGEFPFLLKTLRAQTGIGPLEIIVVDSGSTDQTLETAEEQGARIVRIPQEQFDHAKTRNLGAESAGNELLLFMVQDALPTGPEWLKGMLEIYRANAVAALSCSEFPREDADLFYRVISWNHANFLGLDQGDRLTRFEGNHDYAALRKNGQLSDVACLVDRKLFLQYQYRLPYAEDLDLGIRLIQAGHRLALTASTRVVHSHNRSPYYFVKRGYVDSLYLREIFSDFPGQPIPWERMPGEVQTTLNRLGRFLASIQPPEGALWEYKNFHGQILEHLERWHWPLEKKAHGGGDWGDSRMSVFFQKYFSGEAAKRERAGNGQMDHALHGFLQTALNYMQEPYPFLSPEVWGDFKQCAWKGFAMICGLQFAECPESDRQNPEWKAICQELKAGV